MSKERSLAGYRAIDLGLFMLIVGLFEFLIVRLGSTVFRTQLYSVSVTCSITCIVFMRWGGWGLIHAMVGGIVWCIANFLSGGLIHYERMFSTLQFLVIYGVGNLLSGLTLPVIKKLGKERIRQSKPLSLLLALLTQFLMHLGRMIFSVIFGLPLKEALAFITTDSLSYLFTLLIVFAACHADGLYEDQRHFLNRFQKQEALKEEQL